MNIDLVFFRAFFMYSKTEQEKFDMNPLNCNVSTLLQPTVFSNRYPLMQKIEMLLQIQTQFLLPQSEKMQSIVALVYLQFLLAWPTGGSHAQIRRIPA